MLCLNFEKAIFYKILNIYRHSLQTGTKLRKSLKVILDCRKLHKSQNKLSNAFRFKDYILQELKAGVIYKFNIESAMNAIMVNV